MNWHVWSSSLNAIGTNKKLLFKEKTTYRKEKGLPMYDETIFFFFFEKHLWHLIGSQINKCTLSLTINPLYHLP